LEGFESSEERGLGFERASMISVDWSAAVVVALVLLLMLALDRLFFEPLARAIEGRRDLVERSEKLWQETSEAAAQAFTTWREATNRVKGEGYLALDRARAEAQAERQRRLDAARQQALGEVAAARASLRAQAEAATSALESEADRLAAEIASRLLGRRVA
jgi:F-type H+-transporting ATPase subunit b